METNENKKRIAVVSGGTGYVGSAVVKQLAADGFIVAILTRNSSKDNTDMVMKSLGCRDHKIYSCNLESFEDVETILNTIETEMGNIYVSVHTAGMKPERKSLVSSNKDDMDAQYAGTILPAFNFLTLSAKKLKSHNEGILIGITTIGVVKKEATKSLGAYIPAKYAVQGILTTLKEELSGSNITVHSIAPGFMPSGMNADIPKAFVQMIEAKSPSKTLASAEIIASKISDICKGDSHTDELTITIAPEYGM